MKIITNIIRLAHIPPHCTISEMDGLKGFWTVNQDGHRIFLDIKSHRIIIPKALRGQNPQDISDEDFKAIPKEESGDSSYKLWQEDFNRNKAATKIYDGFEFTNNGKILIDRLKKSILKHHLDNIAVYSLDPKYSIKPEMFDKLMQQTNMDRAKYMAKIIAKKYRVIIELLKASGKIRAANKIDGDFYYNWNKLEPLFDFDPAKYKPKLNEEKEEEVEENPAPTDTLQNIVQAFVAEVEPLIDAQMSDFVNILDSFQNVVKMGNIELSQRAYEVMSNILIQNISRYYKHPIGIASERILHLSSYALLHHRLFEEGQ